MTKITIIGAGPYGLSLAATLSFYNIEHRIFGKPMQFWENIANAGEHRFLKSYCFGTNLVTPKPGFTFADYSRPRGLETFEPCSMRQFSDYGRWFQKANVDWAEPVDVASVSHRKDGFEVTLNDGQQFLSESVVVATGLANFDFTPVALRSLSPHLITHTNNVSCFAAFKGLEVAVIGAGQSALEAAALLNEAGAKPHLLVREHKLLWQVRTPSDRNLWRKLRSPISGLGSGPKAWALTNFPGAMHRAPIGWRTRFVKNHLPAEGAWWLRERVVDQVKIDFGVTVAGADEASGQARLCIDDNRKGRKTYATYDHVIAGSGYSIDIERLNFLDPALRSVIQAHERSPLLNTKFESSVPGLYFIGPTSAMSFGPLFRFVIGAEYSCRILGAHLAAH